MSYSALMFGLFVIVTCIAVVQAYLEGVNRYILLRQVNAAMVCLGHVPYFVGKNDLCCRQCDAFCYVHHNKLDGIAFNERCGDIDSDTWLRARMEKEFRHIN